MWATSVNLPKAKTRPLGENSPNLVTLATSVQENNAPEWPFIT
jgi:hypothetical protein